MITVELTKTTSRSNDYRTSSTARLQALLMQQGFIKDEVGSSYGVEGRWKLESGGGLVIFDNSFCRVYGGKKATRVREVLDAIAAKGEIAVPPFFPEPLAASTVYTQLPTLPCSMEEVLRAHEAGEMRDSGWQLTEVEGSRWREMSTGHEVIVEGLDFYYDQGKIWCEPVYGYVLGSRLGKWQQLVDGCYSYTVSDFVRVDHWEPAAALHWFGIEIAYLVSDITSTVERNKYFSQSTVKRYVRMAEDKVLEAVEQMRSFAIEHDIAPLDNLPAEVAALEARRRRNRSSSSND